MSDTMTETDPQDESHNIKLLREKAALAESHEARAVAAERELALTKSGIDTSTPLGEFFVKSYAGDVADVEAIKAEAQRLGVPLQGGTPPPADPATGEATPAGEVADTGSAERRELAASESNPGEEAPDPRQVAREQFDTDMKRGLSQDDAGGRWVATLAQAAMAGDKRVIVEGR